MRKNPILVAKFAQYPMIFGHRSPIKCLYAKYRNGHLCPCGKCYFCRRSQATQWAFRVQAEAENSNYVYNVMLTYDDITLPFDAQGRPIVVKRHLTEMLKRFRDRLARKYDAHIRFFACGEYGGNTHRPHYHMIVFSDVDLCSKDGRGKINLRNCHKELFESWKKGFVTISRYDGEVGKMVRYMTQYMYMEDGSSRKPFRHMSRMPAIGAAWLDQNRQAVRDMQKYEDYTLKHNGVPYPLPRYYREKLISPEAKQRNLERYDKKCADYFLLTDLLNYETTKTKLYAREKLRDYQAEQYRKRKVHHINQHPSGLFTQGAKRR